MINIPILMVGDTGTGKSSSFRNLPPERTVVINIERKILPFKSFRKFKNINISKYKDFEKVMRQLKESDKYDYVVIDSLTSLIEIINKYCESVYSGYSVWSEYNNMIWNTLQDIKELPQQVFVTAIPELVEVKPGETKAFARVKAKEHKAGGIEKEFTIVLHTDLLEDEEGNIIEYRFDTKPSKYTSAKSPDGLFEDRYIPNDAVEIVKAIKSYYEEE